MLVQVESNPEYLRWPGVCCCCCGPDERNLEIAVPSTDQAEHEEDVIMAVELPYCLECWDHAHADLRWSRIIAVWLGIWLVGLGAAWFLHPLGTVLIAASCIGCAAYFGYELQTFRKRIRRSCSAFRDHVRFVAPTDSRSSAIVFTNRDFADRFRMLNR
jgi:hypothetical protein